MFVQARGKLMRRLVGPFLVLCALMAMPLQQLAGAQAASDVHLTILHTNDTHGHLLPYSFPDTFDADSDIVSRACSTT